MFQRLQQFLQGVQADRVSRLLPRLGRFLHMLGYRFLEDGGLHHTASLTYTTLLSLVPLMTVSLAILSAFPVAEQLATGIQDFVFANFVPASGEVIREHLVEFAQKASSLSGVGTAFLVVTAVMMINNIDRAFNTIWQVRHQRSSLSMFMVYWAILSLGPVFIGISVATTSYLVSMPLLTDAAETIGIGRGGLLGLMPVLASAVAFTLLYTVVPNRRVYLRHAVIGGVLAAFLFELAKRGFALYVTTFPTYQAIYGALAAVPVFLLWIYLCWLITLLGAEFTYCLSIYRDEWHPGRCMYGDDLLLAYRLLGYLWDAQRRGAAVAVDELLAREARYSETDLETALFRLKKARLVLRTERGQWALARDMNELSFLDLVRSGRFVLPTTEAAALSAGAGGAPELVAAISALEKQLQQELSVPLARLFEARTPADATDR